MEVDLLTREARTRFSPATLLDIVIKDGPIIKDSGHPLLGTILTARRGILVRQPKRNRGT